MFVSVSLSFRTTIEIYGTDPEAKSDSTFAGINLADILTVSFSFFKTILKKEVFSQFSISLQFYKQVKRKSLCYPVHLQRRRWQSPGESCSGSLQRLWNCSADGGVEGRAPPSCHTLRATAEKGRGPQLLPCPLCGPHHGRHHWLLGKCKETFTEFM